MNIPVSKAGSGTPFVVPDGAVAVSRPPRGAPCTLHPAQEEEDLVEERTPKISHPGAHQPLDPGAFIHSTLGSSPCE